MFSLFLIALFYLGVGNVLACQNPEEWQRCLWWEGPKWTLIYFFSIVFFWPFLLVAILADRIRD